MSIWFFVVIYGAILLYGKAEQHIYDEFKTIWAVVEFWIGYKVSAVNNGNMVFTK